MNLPGVHVCLGLAALTAALAHPVESYGQAAIGQNLPLYRPADKVTGKITLVGSNTMSQLAGGWVEQFQQFHPDAQFEIIVKGSASAVTSVMSGEATFGLLSRSITRQEYDAFQTQFNYPPKVLTPALELMAIYVHKDNPVTGLTMEQLRSIFGQEGTAATWGDVGGQGAWASRPITIQGRSPITGSTVYIQQVVLGTGPMKSGVVENPTNLDLVNAVAANPTSIGYAGLAYQLGDVRTLAIAGAAGQSPVAIDSLESAEGRYPLTRPLQVVINHAPGQELPKIQKEFLKYIFSRLGQEEVIKGGFQPVPGANARFALDQVGLRELN